MKIHLNRWQQAVRKAQAFIAVAVGLLFCAIGTATAQDMSHHHMDLNADPTAESEDRKSTRLNSSHVSISYAVFCLKKKKQIRHPINNDTILNHHIYYYLDSYNHIVELKRTQSK